MSINGVNESPPCEKFNEILVECKDLLIKKVTISVIVKINFRKNGVFFSTRGSVFFLFFFYAHNNADICFGEGFSQNIFYFSAHPILVVQFLIYILGTTILSLRASH